MGLMGLATWACVTHTPTPHPPRVTAGSILVGMFYSSIVDCSPQSVASGFAWQVHWVWCKDLILSLSSPCGLLTC